MKTLESLTPLAIRSYNGTSFDPEKRGQSLINEFSELLNRDLKEIDRAGEPTRIEYTKKFVNYLSHYLSAKSRCYSPMIIGPSNFPVRQQEKYRNWEQSAYNRFNEWREKALKAIKKDIEQSKSQELKDAEAWESIKACILDKAQVIFDIDNGKNTYSARQLFTASLAKFIERMAKNGQTEHVKKSIELIRKLNTMGPKPIITEKHKIFSMVEVAEKIQANKEALNNKENDKFDFDGGKVVFNYSLNRLQIKHDVKPSYEVRQTFKKKGFKWSPNEKAWQRFLTNESKYVASDLLNIKLY